MRLSPADYVIRTIGGVRKTARVLGKTPAAVSKWTKPHRDGGCAGGIPRRAMSQILNYAFENDLDIRASDLVVGRSLTPNKPSK